MEAGSQVTRAEMFWAIGSLCSPHLIPFDSELALGQLPPPYDIQRLVHALRSFGFKALQFPISGDALGRCHLPCLGLLRKKGSSPFIFALASRHGKINDDGPFWLHAHVN